MEDHESHANGESPESPCLKSSRSRTTINNNNHNNYHHHHSKEQDRFLPIANVGRIMKKVIPVNGKISKDAKETVQECVSEFISFVTGEASDKCQREKRKTINGDDIMGAITTLGFEDYVQPLKVYLSKYKEIEGEKVHMPKQLKSSSQQVGQVQDEHLEQEQKLGFSDHHLYSPTNILSHAASFLPTDHHHQVPFLLPDFSPNDTLQKQILPHPQDHQVMQSWGDGREFKKMKGFTIN